ncbi:MAG: chromate transporter [Planctomycetota bacterium]
MREIASVFLRLGFFGFGGPAAHVAMMEELVVEKGKWIDREHFLDLVGLTNLIPGPNSTEMAIHLGLLRGGVRGMLIAGFCFLGPAILMTGGIAFAYAQYGDLAWARAAFAGIQPAVIAVILVAGYRLGKKAVTGPVHAVLGIAVAAAVLLGAPEIVALFAGTAIGTLVLARVQRSQAGELMSIFLFFLKVGSILYGSGYLLVAFIQSELVPAYLTQSELLDAIAVGQFTPGPVLSTATFLGFQMAGWPGAVVATIGIFLPSFVLVWLFRPIFRRLRESPRAASFLAAVRVAAVALLAAVLVDLGREVLITIPAAIIFLAAVVAGIRFKIGSVGLIAGGGVAGLILGWVS